MERVKCDQEVAEVLEAVWQVCNDIILSLHSPLLVLDSKIAHCIPVPHTALVSDITRYYCSAISGKLSIKLSISFLTVHVLIYLVCVFRQPDDEYYCLLQLSIQHA